MAENTGFLTTHILDTANGCPAHGVRIDLFRLDGDTRHHLSTVVTNDDGRTDSPVIEKGNLEEGVYELVFAIGDYFAGTDERQGQPFIDIVPIRFGISDADQHYHVPLLASPYSYSTYRGS